MFKGKIAAFGLAAAVALVSTSAMAAGDAANGEKVFKKCVACHDLVKNKVGPSLGGIVGRKSGAVDGYAYSSAMKGAALTWDAATLSKYLEKPKELIPGNKMAFAGLAAAQDRDDVIAYLAAAK